MSDALKGIPVRTEQDADERVQIKIVDYTTVGQGATVDTNHNLHVQVNANNPAATNTVLKVSEQGSPNGDGFYNVTNNSIPDSSAVIGHTRQTTPANTDQIQRITAIANGTTHALDISLHDDLGAPYNETNPLHVTFSEDGTAVNDYNTVANVAANGGTSNHDYTVTAGKTLKLSQVFFSCAVRSKAEVQIETGVATGVFTSKFVGFASAVNQSREIPIKENISVAAGVRVRVIRTNEDLATPSDVYSTISGHEI